MARATQRAFVNPPAIRGDVHAEKVALCARVTATLGTATVKINSYGHRFPLDGSVFSFKDCLCFDQFQPQLRFFELPSLLLKRLPSFLNIIIGITVYSVLSIRARARAHVRVRVCV